MRKLTTAEVTRMTGTQLESFNDQVTLYEHTSGQDSLGEMTDSFDSGDVIDCGLLTAKQYRNERGQVITIDADAVLRVAMGQIINVGDKVVGRGVTYLVDGVQPGRNVKIVPLMEITI
jgi:hypothetical protein